MNVCIVHKCNPLLRKTTGVIRADSSRLQGSKDRRSRKVQKMYYSTTSDGFVAAGGGSLETLGWFYVP